MECMKLNEAGFVTNFLVSGPKETLVENNKTDNNQLRNETYLRSIIADSKDIPNDNTIRIGEKSELNMPWEYYYSHENWFIDKSTFYPLVRKIEMLAVTNIVTECARTIKAVVWTYGAFELWVNGEKQGQSTKPVYKPISKNSLELSLAKGTNEVYIRFQNLGVRDTRNILGLQIVEDADTFKVLLPDEEKAEQYRQLEEILNSCNMIKNKLKFVRAHAGKMILRYDHKTDDYFAQTTRYEEIDITGKNEVDIRAQEKYLTLVGMIDGFSLQRKLEILDNIKPQYITYRENENSADYVYKEISKVGAMLRGSIDRFSMYNILARRAVDNIGNNEEIEILNDLQHIENRRDCSDFILCAYMRYVRLYPLNETLEKRTKEVLLNYRYWMNQEGLDGMCFWSENHSLLFYISALMAGQLYPNDTFVRANKTGKELEIEAFQKINQWLDDVLEMGFEEFQSGGYTPITYAGLLNLVDFEMGELGEKATKVLDKILEMLALHTFKGSVVSPQGRVYREVLYPCNQSVQVLIHMLDKEAPYYFSEWVSMMATSSYKWPKRLIGLMNTSLDCEYATGNALVKLYKTQDYIVTSVQSKREDKNPIYWENICAHEDVDINSYEYCKSLNECFHGTSCFEPGVYGYQQHMCYIGLDNDTVVFINHPGGTCDATTMRPGYWFGNGIMPAIKQNREMFGVIYDINEDYPIPFTHVFFPVNKFQQVIDSDGWKCGKKEKSYVAVWNSGEMKEYNDQLFGCEFRVMDPQTGYLCVAGSEEEYGDFDTFIKYCKKLNPIFSKEENILRCDNGFIMRYERCFNETQYI